MNLQITIPNNWNPNCTKTINKWFTKIERSTRKQKGLKLNKS
jgi:hypothetical protein